MTFHIVRPDGSFVCPEAELRDQMSDGEFWAHVADPGPYYDPDDDENIPRLDDPVPLGPCPECGEVYACGYDAEGRPMIHVVNDDDSEDD